MQQTIAAREQEVNIQHLCRAIFSSAVYCLQIRSTLRRTTYPQGGNVLCWLLELSDLPGRFAGLQKQIFIESIRIA